MAMTVGDICSSRHLFYTTMTMIDMHIAAPGAYLRTRKLRMSPSAWPGVGLAHFGAGACSSSACVASCAVAESIPSWSSESMSSCSPSLMSCTSNKQHTDRSGNGTPVSAIPWVHHGCRLLRTQRASIVANTMWATLAILRRHDLCRPLMCDVMRALRHWRPVLPRLLIAMILSRR